MTPETKTILPDEIKKWIEDEAYNDLRNHKYEDLDGVWIAGATSLYQHLSEQKDKEMVESLALYNNQTETISRHLQEIKRLKGLIQAMHFDGWADVYLHDEPCRALTDKEIDNIEQYFEIFKTENNL